MHINSCQKIAVEDLSKRLLIIAGAGTGKTFTIIEKIAHMMENENIDYSNILATAFTQKAAGELKERLAKRFGPEANNMSIGTFHSLSFEMLQNNGYINKNTTILNADSQLKLITDIILKNRLLGLSASSAIDKIQKCKEGGMSLLKGSECSLFNLYQAHLKENNILDFSDLITLLLAELEKKPDLLSYYHNKFKLICTDEFQDVSELQWQWLNKLLTDQTWLVCVGDPDQAIYGFRGANCKYILNFEKYFPNASIVKLECNYRSGQTIIDAANYLIKHNKNRPQKNLYSADPEAHSTVSIQSFNSPPTEAIHIAKKIMANYAGDLDKVGILVRNRSQMIPIAQALSASGISYGNSGVQEKTEFKDVKAYMSFILDSTKIEDFQRIISAIKNGIGAATISKIIDTFYTNKMTSIIDAIKIVASTLKQQGPALLKFVESVDIGQTYTHVAPLATFILSQSEYGQTLEADRKTSLKQWIDLLPDIPVKDYFIVNNQKGVNLMTIHASKGLEFDYVFLPRWEKDSLPHRLAVGSELEEERRLAYVAITRAKKHLHISHTQIRIGEHRMQHNEASMFINELRPAIMPKAESRQMLKPGQAVFHPSYGRGSVVECGARAAMVKFFTGKKLVMLHELSQ